MGSVASAPRGDAHRKEDGDYLLGILVGEKAFDVHSNLWDRLLGLPLTLQWPDEVVKEACKSMARNSISTCHLAKLLLHLAWSLQEAACAAPNAHETFLKATNAIRISRVFLKHLIESSTNDQLMSCLSLCLSEKEAKVTGLSKGYQNVAAFLVGTMLGFICNSDVNSTFWLHFEVGNLLLVMMSTQLHSTIPFGPKDVHVFLDAAMTQDRPLVQLVVHKLLLLYIARLPTPADSTDQAGVLQRVGSAAVSLIKLPYYTYNYLLTSNTSIGPSPLAQNSLLLLLVLIHHRKGCRVDKTVHEKVGVKGDDTAVAVADSNELVLNPFCQALDSARDTEFDLVDLESNTEGGSVTKFPFSALYDTIGLCLKEESSVLLLYSLVHGNPAFLEYVLVRADLDTLVMPLMEMLYDVSRKTSKQIYMLLTILLILSQDASFSASVHKLVLQAVPWYKERLLNQTTLGSLMVVILIRTVNINLPNLKDVHLQTNCLAILSNMAPHTHRLNAYAAQRLISLFDMLSRKCMKLADANSKLSHTMLNTGNVVENADGVPTYLHIYTDFLRIVLEIINAILTYALPRNPEVVYALLHQQELFQPLRNHIWFYELIENLYTVLDFFNVRMETQNRNGDWSVDKVLQVVIANTRSWRGEGMKMFTQLQFTYEEELHSEEFFVPYVWQIVVSNSGIMWDLDTLMLFSSSETFEHCERSASFRDKPIEMVITPGVEL